MAEHNYQKIKISMAMGESKVGEPRKIDWNLEVLKKNKSKYEELISWFSKETEWADLKLLTQLFKNDRGEAVLNMKSEREGLKNFCLFIMKEIPDVQAEIIATDEVLAELAKLPDSEPAEASVNT